MAYYVNGTLIGGANTLPKMTMAEYLALPADQRPTYWECTDKDYVDISAENVSYGDGTVEDALDELGDYKLLFNGNPTTANTFTEFDLDGSLADYRFLIFIYIQYYNTMLSFVEPRALFDIQTSNNSRVYMQLNGNLVAQIYKVSNTKIALYQTDVSGPYKVRIYGFN